LLSPPLGTEMFQFPRFASVPYRTDDQPKPAGRVPPFGHPGISACVPLPLAYRSLPRPSSPPCAQASSTRPRSLDYGIEMQPSRARAIYSSSEDTSVTDKTVVTSDDSLPTNYYHNPLSNSVLRPAPRPGRATRKLTSSRDRVSRRATYRERFRPSPPRL
jgi:hypothetical protein